jgi:ribosomal protein S18 acetylase RimI-like enzyme
MKIREANFYDIDAIVDFQLAMAKETENIDLDIETLSTGVKNAMKDRNKGFYIVAEENGITAGSLLITFEWSDWRNGWVYWIQSVYVIEEFRKKGVYKKMYDFIQEMVKNDEEIKGIRLYVDKTNTLAQKVYAKMGMNGDHYQLYEWMKEF